MGNVLCNGGKVTVTSLPHCLRHMTTHCAADDARELVIFLDEIVFAMQCAKGDAYLSRGHAGLALVLGLLLDKIEISSEQYKFPTHGPGDDVPALVARGWEEE